MFGPTEPLGLSLRRTVRLGLVFAVAFSSRPSGQQPPPIHVWATVVVSPPLLSTSDQVNVQFVATNLGSAPIPVRVVRQETVLVINGEAWADSAFTFSNGIFSSNPVLEPRRSILFTYQLTRAFKKPGI